MANRSHVKSGSRTNRCLEYVYLDPRTLQGDRTNQTRYPTPDYGYLEVLGRGGLHRQ